MEKMSTDKKTLKKFGITMAIALLTIAVFIFLRHRHSNPPIFIASALFFLTAVALPGILKPIYIFWMRLAFVLSWINTRIILVIIFYAVFTPIGLTIRLFGRDLLDRKIEKDRDSYWKEKEKSALGLSGYERQF